MKWSHLGACLQFIEFKKEVCVIMGYQELSWMVHCSCKTKMKEDM